VFYEGVRYSWQICLSHVCVKIADFSIRKTENSQGVKSGAEGKWGLTVRCFF
jgi:hypothetical protein